MPDTYVLVHGAWHGPWGWRPVAQELRSAGHDVVTVGLPGLKDGDDPTACALEDCVEAVVTAMAGLEDVVLVGHSWGGYVITGAANRASDRLKRLVYWSAFVPAAGRSLYDEVPPPYQELFGQLAEASHDNSVALPLEVFQQAFIQDAGEDVQRLVHSLLVPQPMQYFTQYVDPLGDIGITPEYVLSRDDVALPPGEYGWARFAQRLGVEPIDAPGSHEALFTEPAGLAAALRRG